MKYSSYFATNCEWNAASIFLQQQLPSAPAQLPLLAELLRSLNHLYSESLQYHEEPQSPSSLARRPRGTWRRSRCTPSPATRPTAASSGISGDYPSIGLSFSAQSLYVLRTKIWSSQTAPRPHRLHWILALIEKANCNLMVWMRASGFEMWAGRDDWQGSAGESQRLAEIMGMWVWSV